MLKATQQWVGSPLGYNILLSLLKDGRPSVEKYIQIANHIKRKNICAVNTKLFVSSSYRLKSDVIKSMNVSEVLEVDFSKRENALFTWVNANRELKTNDITKEFNSKTEYVLANVSSLQSPWASSNDSGPVMKIYNSFTYTQDVKYEARLLELPLQSGLKLVILVPNEVDVLPNLYAILNEQGLGAAVRSIQPLFTVNCELNAPNINISSRTEISEKVIGFTENTIAQYGAITVDKTGASVTVLTCLYSPAKMTPVDNQSPSIQPFYLAVVYEDTPLFTGQFTK